MSNLKTHTIISIFCFVFCFFTKLNAEITWQHSCASEERGLKIEESKPLEHLYFAQDKQGNLLLGGKGTEIQKNYQLTLPMIHLASKATVDLLDEKFIEASFSYAFSSTKRNNFYNQNTYKGLVTEVPSGNTYSFSEIAKQRRESFPKSNPTVLNSRVRLYRFSLAYGKVFKLNSHLTLESSLGFFLERMKFSYHRYLPFQSLNTMGPRFSFRAIYKLTDTLSVSSSIKLSLPQAHLGHFPSNPFAANSKPSLEGGLSLMQKAKASDAFGVKVQKSQSSPLRCSLNKNIYDFSQGQKLPLKSHFSISQSYTRLVLFFSRSF